MLLYHQFADIIIHHIIPELRAQDAQALAHACITLRQLVRTSLPDSTWESVAANTFPTGHPLRSTPGSSICSCLHALASVQASLYSKVVAEPAQMDVVCDTPGDSASPQRAGLLDEQGQQLILWRGRQILLYKLDLQAHAPGCKLKCKYTASEIAFDAIERVTEVSFRWSWDGQQVAMLMHVKHTGQPGTEVIPYVFNIANLMNSHALHMLASMGDAHPANSLFSPSGDRLIMYGSFFPYGQILDYQNNFFRMYHLTSRGFRLLVSKQFDGANCRSDPAFSSDGRYFAYAISKKALNVYDSNSVLVHPVQITPQGHYDDLKVAWSPDSGTLAAYAGQHIELYDGKNFAPLRCLSVERDSTTLVTAENLIYGVKAISALECGRAEDQGITRQLSFYSVLPKGDAFEHIVACVEESKCHPVFSPCGSFVAIIEAIYLKFPPSPGDVPKDHLVIYDVLSGKCLHLNGMPEWEYDEGPAPDSGLADQDGSSQYSIRWVEMGKHLLVSQKYEAPRWHWQDLNQQVLRFDF